MSAAALATRQQQALLQMDQQLLKEQQLGQAELMRIRTTTGEYRTFSESVKVRLMLAAEELDRINALEAAIKAAGDAESEDIKALAALRREALAGLQRQNDELDRAAGRWRDLIDPTRQYTRQLQEIRALVTQGKLTPQEGISAEFDVESARQDALDQGLNRLKPDEPTWLGTLEGGFRRLFGAIQQGSVTARGVFLGALEMMGTALANTLAKMAASWASTELFKTRVTATGAATRTGVETAAAAKSVAVTSSAASTNIMTRAYEAMAGAYAAIAGIPYVGPVLAPVAAGVAFGAVASLAGRVFSARGGFDVPANINPMTQLHAREMVLPAEQADVIRRLGASGGATQQQPVAVHVHANDARSVEDLIGRDHRRAARLAQRMSSIASVRRGT